jgi:hypothetical protein
VTISGPSLPWLHRLVLAAVAIVLLGAVGLIVVLARPDEAPTARSGTAATQRAQPATRLDGDHAQPFAGHWLQVLAALDARRAAAWRAGSAEALTDVFLPGSLPLATDRARLLAYRSRGLTVTGVHVGYFVVSARRLPSGAEALIVYDRLDHAIVHDGSGGSTALPVDEPSRHRLVLQRVTGGWRIARITPA